MMIRELGKWNVMTLAFETAIKQTITITLQNIKNVP